MTKAQIDAIDYQVVLLRRGDINNTINLTPYINSNNAKQGVKMENDTFDLTFNLEYEYTSLGKVHQFCDLDNGGKLLVTKKDIVRVFIKRVDGTSIDITNKEDLLGEYFVKDYSLSPMSFALTLTLVDINYKIYNRIFSGSYGIKDGGSYTSSTSLTITDTSQSWTEDQWANKTLELRDSDDVTYNYLIVSNTSTTITVHTSIVSGTISSYSIGESSPNVILEGLKRVTPTIRFNGEYLLNTTYTTDYGSDYRQGISILRPDGMAYPIIDYSQSNKAYYKMIAEVGAKEAVNTLSEIEGETTVITRDMMFSTQYDTEKEKYVCNWYPSLAIENDMTSTMTGIGSNTITDSTLSLATGEWKGKLIRIGSKSYNILSNTSDTLTLSASGLDNIFEVGDNYSVYSNADFIWDSDDDYRHIYNYKASNKTDGTVNHIYFSVGKNEMAGREMKGHRLNKNSDSTSLTETYIPMTYIAKNVLDGDDRNNNDGTYSYPSYGGGYLIHNKNGEPYLLSESVTSNAEYNANLKKICRDIAYKICDSRFANIKEGTLKITFTVRGNKYLQAGNSADKSKIYNTGSVIVFKDIANGIVNDEQKDGYYYLNIDTIRHQITSDEWVTTIDTSANIYTQEELNP